MNNTSNTAQFDRAELRIFFDKIKTEIDKEQIELSKEMQTIVNNEYDMSKFKDVHFISPSVYSTPDEMEQVRENFYKILRQMTLAKMKEHNVSHNEISVEVNRKIRFNIEGKFIIEGLMNYNVSPLYKMNGSSIAEEDYVLDDFDIDIALSLQSPVTPDDNIPYSYKSLLDSIKKSFRKNPFMFYSDISQFNNVVYDFEHYIDNVFLTGIFYEFLLTGYDTVEFKKKGNIIQTVLKNENTDETKWDLKSHVNADELPIICKKFIEVDREVEQFFME